VTTQIKAELNLASRNSATGDMIYTFVLTYPRPLLGEVLTHRVASRNTSSTRAIPTSKMIKAVIEDPYIPIFIGQNQKGMNPGAELDGWRRKTALALIRGFRYAPVALAYLLTKLGVHKGIAGRYLEPYSWVRQVFSVTEVENLLLLRNHSDAEPHFRELAKQMEREIRIAKGTLATMDGFDMHARLGYGGKWKYQILKPGEWHLPFLTSDEVDKLSLHQARSVSAARCARTSYTLVGSDKLSKYEDDFALCQRLSQSAPIHASPFEHQAEAMVDSDYIGNFRGWKQYRKYFRHESGGDPQR
jgi:hypothetical protein